MIDCLDIIYCPDCGGKMEIVLGSLVSNMNGKQIMIEDVECIYCYSCEKELYTEKTSLYIGEKIKEFGLGKVN